MARIKIHGVEVQSVQSGAGQVSIPPDTPYPGITIPTGDKLGIGIAIPTSVLHVKSWDTSDANWLAYIDSTSTAQGGLYVEADNTANSSAGVRFEFTGNGATIGLNLQDANTGTNWATMRVATKRRGIFIDQTVGSQTDSGREGIYVQNVSLARCIYLDHSVNSASDIKSMVISAINAGAGRQIALAVSSGQVTIGTLTPSTKAALQVDSTTQGFLPPRMTSTERDAITSPPAGLMIYNTTTNKLNVYTTAWEQVTSA